MVNNRQRGLQFQRWIADWIIEKHPQAVVHNQIGASTRIPVRDKKTGLTKEIWISKNMDIFGCIDLIVIIPGKKPLFIQATLDTGTGRKLQDLVQVPWPFEFCTVQLWQKREDGVVLIKDFTGAAFHELGQIVRRKYYKLERDNNAEDRNDGS
jgi:hypothetical protein